MAKAGKGKVAVIIPARNEAERIGSVLKAVTCCPVIDEIWVVDDGSSDDTSQVAARAPGVKVITLPSNIGKGGAMAKGVKATNAPILAFVDADLGGLTSEHLEKIITPLLRDECDMCVGIFRGGKVWSDAAQRVSPYLSGQRALKREIFEATPFMEESGMGVEVALNHTAKRRKARVLRVILRGVSNTHKEQKEGLMKGAASRIKMWYEIGQVSLKPKKRRRRRWTKKK